MIFQSQLEELMVAEELLFNSTPGFGRYRPYMEQAIAHPAKMNTKLLEFLIKTHTKEGDVVLDPMAGSGSTGVISALNGRNAICVELEEKFFGWMEEARKKVESYSNLSDKGKVVNIKGDARQLSNLVQHVDLVLTSPPYGEAQQGQGIAKYGYQGDKHSPTDLVGKRSYMPDKFESKDNISCLSMGDIDAVITSPPYSESNLGGGDCDKRKERLVKAGYNPEEFLGGEARNTVLKHYDQIDAVITSPPYEQSLEGGTRHYQKGGGHFKIIDDKNLPTAYSFRNDDQIGNLKKETYLEAMFAVYHEMWKILKPEASAIIVIKPFIRNKKVVDLPWLTWLLLEKVGFKLAKVYKLRLKQDSFWRVLYKQKYPNVPQIKHEYVLVCQKSPSFCV